MSTIIENNTITSLTNNGRFPSKDVMLDLKDLKKVYPTPKGDYVVLEDLNLQIKKEEFVTIIGHSGCGKTTADCHQDAANSVAESGCPPTDWHQSAPFRYVRLGTRIFRRSLCNLNR